MGRHLLFILIAILSISDMEGRGYAVIADSVSRMPLPSASVFDRNGKAIGMTDNKGRLPYISPNDLPVTLRYLGFREKTVNRVPTDTVFLAESANELQEVVIESKRHKILHILAYVREYSTLSTYTDTVFLFREKMVDYMVTPDKKVRYRERLIPRVLKSESYYRFTNADGLDSVSSKCNNHFSWSDWMGLVPSPEIPSALKGREYGTDTIRGKYSPTEIWMRSGDRMIVDINVLADTASRKWVPNLSLFFRDRLDFEHFRVRFNYTNLAGDTISPTDIAGYTFNIESNGRGHDMFRFNRKDEPFFVSTFGEVHILDKEYITVKEAKKWDKMKLDTKNIEIIEPADAPEIQPAVKELIARVNSIDHNDARLGLVLDKRMLVGPTARRQKQHFGQRAFTLLKDLTGITSYKSRRNLNKQWNTFRKSQTLKNQENIGE